MRSTVCTVYCASSAARRSPRNDVTGPRVREGHGRGYYVIRLTVKFKLKFKIKLVSLKKIMNRCNAIEVINTIEIHKKKPTLYNAFFYIQ